MKHLAIIAYENIVVLAIDFLPVEQTVDGLSKDEIETSCTKGATCAAKRRCCASHDNTSQHESNSDKTVRTHLILLI